MAWPWDSKFPALQEACCRGLQPCRLLISVPQLAFNFKKNCHVRTEHFLSGADAAASALRDHPCTPERAPVHREPATAARLHW